MELPSTIEKARLIKAIMSAVDKNSLDKKSPTYKYAHHGISRLTMQELDALLVLLS